MEVPIKNLRGNDLTKALIDSTGVKVEVKLQELLQERGMTQTDLHFISGIRIASISEFGTARKGNINISHLLGIMSALRLTDISELISITYPEDTLEQFKEERKEAEELGRGISTRQMELLNKHKKILRP